jgi:hypothetical protein
MYPTFAAFNSGWKRIYIESHSRDVKKLRGSALTALLVGVFMPLVAVVGIFIGTSGSPSLFWTSILAATMFIFVIAWLYKINGAPLVFVLLSPIGAIVVAWILFGAASMLQNRKPICWGGKEYILEPRSS